MGRIVGIDYGLKRTGLSVTDPLCIIVNGLDTVPTVSLLDYLQNYFKNNEVENSFWGIRQQIQIK